jgi:hypothetical protein
MAASYISFPNNVGVEGGDLPTRRFALIVMFLLTLLAVPWFGLSHAALKIAGLAAAMVGTLFLMAGLVFFQKTHFAGLMLVPAPLAMVGLSAIRWRWAAVLWGVLVIGWMAQNLVTKRCGFNRLLGINSCECDT